MATPECFTTYFIEYTDFYDGNFENYFQIHFFSATQIFSIYYDPKYYSLEKVRELVNFKMERVIKKTQVKIDLTLFEKKDKFLIAPQKELIHPDSLLVFDEEKFRYDYNYEIDDFFELIGKTRPDVFIKNALISVGAEKLYSKLKTQAQNLCKKLDKENARFDELRELDKTDPKYKMEVYKIGRSNIPVKVDEFICHSHESAISLPERKKIWESDERIATVFRDLATNEILEDERK